MKVTFKYFLLFSTLLFSCSEDNLEESIPPTIKPTLEIPIENTMGVIKKTTGVLNGYTLFTPSKSKNTYLINNCGQLINKCTSNYNAGKSVYLLKNGYILRAGEILNSNIKIGGIGGVVELFDWENNLVWSNIFSSEQQSQHHDAISLPNGNILILIATRKTRDEAILNGRDPNTLLDGELYNEQIIEIELIGSNDFNIVWEWNVWDHLIQDFDASKNNYGIIKDHPELLDINFIGRYEGKADWLHANSIQYNEDLDQIIISFQGTSEFFIIDHSTTASEAKTNSGGNYGKGGDILYRWGTLKCTNQEQKLIEHYMVNTILIGFQIIILMQEKYLFLTMV